MHAANISAATTSRGVGFLRALLQVAPQPKAPFKRIVPWPSILAAIRRASSHVSRLPREPIKLRCRQVLSDSSPSAREYRCAGASSHCVKYYPTALSPRLFRRRAARKAAPSWQCVDMLQERSLRPARHIHVLSVDQAPASYLQLNLPPVSRSIRPRYRKGSPILRW
jgi:hypothetical protein